MTTIRLVSGHGEEKEKETNKKVKNLYTPLTTTFLKEKGDSIKNYLIEKFEFEVVEINQLLRMSIDTELN